MNPQPAYLLDTNVVSEMMQRSPTPQVAESLNLLAEDGIAISSITVWEILNGIGRLAPGRRRDDLLNRFLGVISELFEEQVLDWSAGDAEVCAKVMEDKRRCGEPLDDQLPDAMLAGTALSRKLTFVTRNEKEFRNTGIVLVNPWTDLPKLVSRKLSASLCLDVAETTQQVNRNMARLDGNREGRKPTLASIAPERSASQG